MMLRLGGHAKTTGNLANLNAALFAGVFGYKFDQDLADARAYSLVLGNLLL